MPRTGLPNYQPIPQSPAGGGRGRGRGMPFDPMSILGGAPSFTGGAAGPAYSDATGAPVYFDVNAQPFVATGPFALRGTASQTGTPGGSVGAITAGNVVWLALLGLAGFIAVRAIK